MLKYYLPQFGKTIFKYEYWDLSFYDIIMKNLFKLSKQFGYKLEEFDYNEKPKKVISVINGLKLPDDYLAFISKHNGGEGPLGENNYGRFYKIEELEAINEDYDVQNSWPGYVVIGGIDDVLWACNPEKKVYCQIDSCNTDEDTYYTISNNFEEFLMKMDGELAD